MHACIHIRKKLIASDWIRGNNTSKVLRVTTRYYGIKLSVKGNNTILRETRNRIN